VPRRLRLTSVDHLKQISDVEEIEAWLGFDFPARGDKYSQQKYHWYHFTGTDYNAANNKTAIYKILGDNKDWARDVDKEKGNYGIVNEDISFAPLIKVFRLPHVRRS